jgi:hypothetical protein
MLSKCANPKCMAPFLYLHTGKLFRVERRAPVPQVEPAMSDKKPARSIEYYWLCEACSSEFILARADAGGIVVRPRPDTAIDVAS